MSGKDWHKLTPAARDEQRRVFQQKIVGKMITAIVWNDAPLFNEVAEAGQVSGFVLSDGSYIYLSASGQIDIDRVWLDVEEKQ